jgi:hypothetical protein
LLIAVFTSCKKKEQGIGFSYIVTNEFAVDFNKVCFYNLPDVVSLSVNEIASIKPHVKSDLKAYKVVHKATVNANKIEATGLICLNADRCNYYVLYFRNGTNTLLDPVLTENVYCEMLQDVTSRDIRNKAIVPGVNHLDYTLPRTIQGIMFFKDLRNSKQVF